MAADGNARDQGAAQGCTTNPLLSSAGTYDGEPRRTRGGDVDDEHTIVLGGRGQLRCPPMNRHTFSATFSNAEGPPVINPTGQHQGFLQLAMRVHDPRTYVIKSAGYDIMRASVEPVLPLRLSDLQGVPAGALLSLKTQMKMAIRLFDFVDRQPIIIDWGQEVEVLCDTLQVGIVGPDNLIYVPPDNERTFFNTQSSSSLAGNVLDSVLDLAVWATEAPRGDLCYATLTTNHVIAATTNPVIQVPTNAIAMTGFQSPLGAATAAWTMLYNNNQIGSIPWAVRKTVDEEIPIPSVSHIQPDIDPVNIRAFTIRWKIQL